MSHVVYLKIGKLFVVRTVEISVMGSQSLLHVTGGPWLVNYEGRPR